MTPEQRRTLLEIANNEGLTWRGERAIVAGWMQDYATVTTRRAGFFGASWETVERAIETGTFDGEILWKSGNGWLGY